MDSRSRPGPHLLTPTQCEDSWCARAVLAARRVAMTKFSVGLISGAKALFFSVTQHRHVAAPRTSAPDRQVEIIRPPASARGISTGDWISLTPRTAPELGPPGYPPNGADSANHNFVLAPDAERPDQLQLTRPRVRMRRRPLSDGLLAAHGNSGGDMFEGWVDALGDAWVGPARDRTRNSPGRRDVTISSRSRW